MVSKYGLKELEGGELNYSVKFMILAIHMVMLNVVLIASINKVNIYLNQRGVQHAVPQVIQNSSRYFSQLKRVYTTLTLTSTEHRILSLHSHLV